MAEDATDRVARARLGDLPEGFDPEKHVRPSVQPTLLKEGVHVLQHDPDTGFYLITKVTVTAAMPPV